MELGAELGLFGMIAITDSRTPRIDREFVLFFHDMYSADLPPFDRDWDCFNGFAYLGNTPTFRARVGERVRWRVAALRTEFMSSTPTGTAGAHRTAATSTRRSSGPPRH
jgi:hypothetical protein